MSIPTEGDTYSQLMEYLRKAQEAAAMMAHLRSAQDDRRNSAAWLQVSENFKKMQSLVTDLAVRKMN